MCAKPCARPTLECQVGTVWLRIGTRWIRDRFRYAEVLLTLTVCEITIETVHVESCQFGTVRRTEDGPMNSYTSPGALVLIQPSYAPLVFACRAHGIGRTSAFELARRGLLATHKIGSRTFVDLESLRTLPERLAQCDQQVAA